MSRLSTFLAGVHVLDLSRHLPGPLATLFLADMGAEVLKLEPPAGDPLRDMSPRDREGRPVYFDALNAGKKVRQIDLAAGREELLALVTRADVLVESFRPGTMDRYGVGYGVLRGTNPRLVYCALTGYGRGSPLAGASGHDLNYLAAAGVLGRNALRHPFVPPAADTAGALFAVASILGALRARDRDGTGCAIEIALADVMMPLQALGLAAGAAVTASAPSPNAGALNGGLAGYGLYRTSDDRQVALAALEPKFWVAFCRAAGREEWVSRHGDPLPQEPLRQELVSFFGAMTLEEVTARFNAVDCCLTPVLRLEEAVESPHHRARGLIRRAADGRIDARFPAHVDGEPPSPRRAVEDRSPSTVPGPPPATAR